MNGGPGKIPAVQLFNRQRAVPLDLMRLRRIAPAAAARCLEHAGPGEHLLGQMDTVEISVVSDRVIARVHRQFMEIPGATDVITFGHGEIVLSAATAARQARENGEEPNREVARYIVHGLLHLNGHLDADPADAAAMWTVQESVLQALWPVGCPSSDRGNS